VQASSIHASGRLSPSTAAAIQVIRCACDADSASLQKQVNDCLAAPQAQPESLPSSRFFDSRAGGSWAADRMSFEEMAQQRRGVATTAAVPAPREGDQLGWGSQMPADDVVSPPSAGGKSDESLVQCGIGVCLVRCLLATLYISSGKGPVLIC